MGSCGRQGSATTRGYEILASLDFTRYARLLMNYTDTDSTRDQNGSRFPGQPNREAFAKLREQPAARRETEWKPQRPFFLAVGFHSPIHPPTKIGRASWEDV